MFSSTYFGINSNTIVQKKSNPLNNLNIAKMEELEEFVNNKSVREKESFNLIY